MTYNDTYNFNNCVNMDPKRLCFKRLIQYSIWIICMGCPLQQCIMGFKTSNFIRFATICLTEPKTKNESELNNTEFYIMKPPDWRFLTPNANFTETFHRSHLLAQIPYSTTSSFKIMGCNSSAMFQLQLWFCWITIESVACIRNYIYISIWL